MGLRTRLLQRVGVALRLQGRLPLSLLPLLLLTPAVPSHSVLPLLKVCGLPLALRHLTGPGPP